MREGFTLIEILIAIAIISILAGGFLLAFSSFSGSRNLNVAYDAIVSSIYSVREKSIVGKDDKTFGIKIQTNNITTFRGASYASRDNGQDKIIAWPEGIYPASDKEFVFAKLVGTTTTDSIVILNQKGISKTITINQNGIISN